MFRYRHVLGSLNIGVVITFPTLHPEDCVVLPRTSSILKGYHGSSTYLEYIGRPLSNGCALDRTSMDFSSHVPCVYRDTP